MAFPKSTSTPSASSPSQMLRESTSKQARISRARASTRESSSLRALRRLRLPLRKRWSSSVPSTRLNFSLNRITENAPKTGAFFFLPEYNAGKEKQNFPYNFIKIAALAAFRQFLRAFGCVHTLKAQAKCGILCSVKRIFRGCCIKMHRIPKRRSRGS